MKLLFVHVWGSSAFPSASRGYSALAYDIVVWCDRQNVRFLTTSSMIKLTSAVNKALLGDDSGPFRPIRPSKRAISCPSLYDDVAAHACKDAPASTRMRTLRSLLDRAATRGQIPAPAIDVPARFEWAMVDINDTEPHAVDGATYKFARVRSRAKNELVDALRNMVERTGGCIDVLVFACESQWTYLESTLGRQQLIACMPDAPKLALREFARKEKLFDPANAVLYPRCVDQSVAFVATCRIDGLLQGLASICGMRLQQVIDSSVRTRCMSMLEKRPQNVHSDEVHAVQGGHVIEPVARLVSAPVCVVDFTSLYPSLIVAHSFGAEFGLPSIVSRLMQQRRDTSEPSIAKACKLIANSFYGQLASSTSSMYNPRLAGEITASGRASLQRLVDAASNHDGTVLYGDTDSAMIVFGDQSVPDATRSCERFLDAFNDQLPEPMRVCLQGVFSACIFISKKKYIAVDRSGSLVSIGTPNVRSDWAVFLKRRYEELAKSFLQGDSVSEDEACTMLRRHCAEIRGSQVVGDFVAYRKIADPNSMSRHAELARQESFKEDGASYSSGDLIAYVVCEHAKCGRIEWRAPENVTDDVVLAKGEYVRMYVDGVRSLMVAARGDAFARVCAQQAELKPDVPRVRHAFSDDVVRQ